MKRMKIKTYSELITLDSFEDRFEYLRLDGIVGMNTFGFDRVFNQQFYRSAEWKQVRDYVIVRDHGCDLACLDHEIVGSRILIHHMNPIDMDDIANATEFLLNPEYLITTMHLTHNAIHYGDKSLIQNELVERSPNDTCPWKM